MALWESHQYSELISHTDNLLLKDSTDFNALVFNGFANFYEGLSHFSLEERIPYIDRAVISLRKALVFNSKDFNAEIYYVLGKTYYHKGHFYTDLAVDYLEKSIAGNFLGEDTYEYLGLLYSAVGRKDKSAESYEKAVESNPSDLLYLALAQVYLEINEDIKAEEYLLRTSNKTTDKELEEKSYFLLSEIYEKRNDVFKMEDMLNKVLQVNSRSADAYYKLGEIYEKNGDNIKARSEWRKALRIDPEHYGARLKLF
jgi:tetratricopeptide (TPR) repeat protein